MLPERAGGRGHGSARGWGTNLSEEKRGPWPRSLIFGTEPRVTAATRAWTWARLLWAGEKLRHLSKQRVGLPWLFHLGLGVVKSNDKTHLAKNPFLKNALEEWVGEALARGSPAAGAGEAGGSPGHARL